MNVIELNDVLKVLEVEQKVRVEKLELEDMSSCGKGVIQRRGICTVTASTYSIHMPADHTAIIQLNVVGEWASNLDHSSWDPD